MFHIQIAIDGPSGAGKSSLSKAVARELGIIYVDTGALYRTVGYYARSIGISSDKSEIARIVPHLGEINIEVKYENGVQCVYLNGENLGDRIRENSAIMAVTRPSVGPTPEAIPKAIARGIATIPTMIPAIRSLENISLLYPLRVEKRRGEKSIENFAPALPCALFLPIVAIKV